MEINPLTYDTWYILNSWATKRIAFPCWSCTTGSEKAPFLSSITTQTPWGFAHASTNRTGLRATCDCYKLPNTMLPGKPSWGTKKAMLPGFINLGQSSRIKHLLLYNMYIWPHHISFLLVSQCFTYISIQIVMQWKAQQQQQSNRVLGCSKWEGCLNSTAEEYRNKENKVLTFRRHHIRRDLQQDSLASIAKP